MIVENAKQHIATAVKIDTQPPYAEVNPLMVSSAPAASPYPTGTPLHKMTSAVSVQITIVSTNTSKISNRFQVLPHWKKYLWKHPFSYS